MQKVTKVVIPAAGFGTRFLPATKSLPKEMFPIVDTPTLQYVVEEAVKSGITDVLIILGKNKKCIEDHFDYAVELENLLAKAGKNAEIKVVRDIADMANFHYIRQKEMKGSGHAILLAKAFVGNEPFGVIYGDDVVYNPSSPALSQLIKAYETTGKTIVGCQNVPREEAIKYGVVQPGLVKGRYTEIKGFVEKPPIDKLPSTLASMGRYVLTPDIFDILETTPPSPSGEIYLTDAILTLANTSGAYAYDFEGKRYDVGDKVGYIEASIEYGLRDDTINDKLKDYLKKIVSTF
ncbi:MAG: UTP--glucose-1-phosphate uridylyltransferase GalU [Clostridia bacterium]|nr:UTP--glucose-1-phosphate uridylyltransferase GalU [Clostridia bacterium]MDY4083393.1 UTP--glucose-1-phosphate uridylyltransferase GalU [Eubacteriales bacterium]